MTTTLVTLVVLGAAAAVAWHRRARAMAVALGALAVLPAATLIQALSLAALIPLAGLAVLVAWHRFTRSSALIGRWSARTRRKAGVASGFDIVRGAGGVAMRRTATKVRPSLAAVSPWRRWCRVPVTEVAVELARAGSQRVWASIEDVVLVFGGPRTGKTGWLTGRVLDAPGMVLVTSTRTDLYEMCAPLRARRGPVWVFNAVGLGGIVTTLGFDPLTGCADPVTAMERAGDMVGASSRAGSSDAERWDAQARRVLAALLHAAALAGGSMHDVLGWVADNDRAASEVPALLRRSQVESFSRAADQFVTTNERTRTSITNSIMPALGWLNHPAAVAAAQGQQFDVSTLLAQRATVFLLGAEEADTGPLVCGLTGHIAREARRLAANYPSGRLDPPLTLALDEAALISPVPLENWTADMGGRGVTIIAAFQSRAQLLARYGEHKTATILNNTAAVMVFGGTRDQADLNFWSTLAGQRDEPVTTSDEHGNMTSRSVRKVPVLEAARIANLPPGRVVVFRRGIDPSLGRVRMAWRRRDIRAHRRAGMRAHYRAVLASRLELVALGRDRALASLLERLARRWSSCRDAAARRRSAADLAAELHRIRRPRSGPTAHESAGEPVWIAHPQPRDAWSPAPFVPPQGEVVADVVPSVDDAPTGPIDLRAIRTRTGQFAETDRPRWSR